MGPAQAIRTGLAKSFQFSGRASRSEFWWFALYFVFGFNALVIAELGLIGFADKDLPPNAGIAFLCLNALALFSVAARRLQDAGRTGKQLSTARFLVPLAIVFVVFAYAANTLGQSEAPGLFAFLAMASILYPWMTLIFSGLLGYLTQESSPLTNPYGPPPSEVTP